MTTSLFTTSKGVYSVAHMEKTGDLLISAVQPLVAPYGTTANLIVMKHEGKWLKGSTNGQIYMVSTHLEKLHWWATCVYIYIYIFMAIHVYLLQQNISSAPPREVETLWGAVSSILMLELKDRNTKTYNIKQFKEVSTRRFAVYVLNTSVILILYTNLQIPKNQLLCGGWWIH